MPTRSVSANVDEELVEEFDAAAESLQTGAYSRSQAIVEAMQMYVTVVSAWQNAQGEPPANENERRVLTDDAIRRRVDYETLTE